MPVYTESALTTIVVPSSGGTLNDTQYCALSPSEHMLDDLLANCIETKNDIEAYFDHMSSEYTHFVSRLDNYLGTDFFSINGESLNLVELDKENMRATNFIEYVSDAISNIVDTVTAINDRLNEVEASLAKMNANYHSRVDLIEADRQRHKNLYAQQPKKENYSNSSDYFYHYNIWQREVTILSNRVTKLEKELSEDCYSTKNSIDVTWYCDENGG